MKPLKICSFKTHWLRVCFFCFWVLVLSDSSFTEFVLELHQPLSLLQAGPLHLEVAAVLPGLGSRLLVHYCLAYTQTPNPAWMLLYHR